MIAAIFRTTDLHSTIAQYSDLHCMIISVLVPTGPLTLMKFREKIFLSFIELKQDCSQMQEKEEREFEECF